MDDLRFSIGRGLVEADPQIMETGKVDLSVYTSQERFEREREIFGYAWLNIAQEGEIPNAGDWIVRDVKIRSASIIIVRGKDMKIRAFHNICAHRGMKLVWDRKGRGGKFSCPYHAWMFDSTGDLVNIPDEGCFSHVDKKESGLTPVRVDTWESFIFVNLDAEGTQSLQEYLGPVAKRLKDMPFESYSYAARVSCEIDANWKLAAEAQCEAYHVRALHSRTVAKMLSSKDNPYVHPIDTELLGAHRLQSVPRNPDFALTPEKLVQAFSIMATGYMTMKSEHIDAVERTFMDHPDLNKTQSNVWGNDQYSLYPHFLLHLALGGCWMHRFWPVAPNKCQWEAIYQFQKPKSLRQVFATQYSLALNRDTLMEDNLALVQQQEVMEGGAKTVVQFGDGEIVCKHLAAVSEAVANDQSAFPAAAE